MNQTITPPRTAFHLGYGTLIKSQIDHFNQERRRLAANNATSPQLWFLTVTFRPRLEDDRLMRPDHSFRLFDQFYVRLLSKLMNNFERKRHLQPLTYAYIDYPFTKVNKAVAPLLAIKDLRKTSLPETAPHIHSLMLIPPALVDRFNEIAPGLEYLFNKLSYANRSLRALPLQSQDDLRNVIFYSSKLLKQVPPALRNVDLYTVLPKAKSERSM